MPIEQQLSEILSELKAIRLSLKGDAMGVESITLPYFEGQKFYKEVFGMDVDLSDVHVPTYQEDFNWVLFVPQGMTLNQAWAKADERFTCRSFIGNDLDAAVPTNDRMPTKAAYAKRFRDRVEADEENKNLSANTLAKRETQNITLLERILLELWYHWRTGQHLDVKNVTLCAGSRHSDGSVPYADWNDGRFKVYYYSPGSASGNLRSRTAL